MIFSDSEPVSKSAYTSEPQPSTEKKHSFLVYRDRLLARSEIFIPRHYQSMTRWFPRYVAMIRNGEALTLLKHPVTTLDQKGASRIGRELLFRITGRAKLFDRLIAETNPKLIHAHFGKSGARILPLARRHHLPLVVTFHGGDATKRTHFRPFWQTGSIFAWNLDALREKGALYLTASTYLKERLIARGFPEARIFPHQIGINTEIYRPNPKQERRLLVLFVGRFVEKKGAPDLIEAMAKVQNALPDSTLALIGDGPDQARLETLAKARLRRYHFVGWQDPTQVRIWMNKARLLAVPSVMAENGDCEGTPSIIYEAHAMGLPVVGTQHSGILEAVKHGETGLLSPEHAPHLLAENILTLLTEKDIWERMSRAARLRAEQDFSITVRTQALEALFDWAIRNP